MQVIKKKDSHIIKIGDYFVSHEYPTKDRDINIARTEVKGRFPEKGLMRNTKVKEIVYVEKGSGKFVSNGKEHFIEESDVIFYNKNEKVYWEGNLTLINACAPAWKADQHEML